MKYGDTCILGEQAYRPLPKLKELRGKLLNSDKLVLLNEFGPVITVLILEIFSLSVLGVLHSRHLTPGSAFESWYILSAFVPTFLVVVIVGVINILKSRKSDSFEARWDREKEVSCMLSYCDPEEISDLHVRLEVQLTLNNQQSATLVIDAAALSGLLAACAAVLAALMVDHKPFMPFMYAALAIASILSGLLLANLSLARDIAIDRRLAAAAFKGLKLAEMREISKS